MEHFSAAALSQTGTVVMQEGEILITSLDRVSFQTHDKKPTTYLSGLLTLTTHRVVWTDPSRRSSISAPLANLPAQTPVEVRSTPFSTRVTVRYGRGIRLDFASSISGKEREAFAQAVIKAVARREWVRIAEAKQKEAAQKAAMAEFRRPKLGAGGVAQKVVQRDTERKQAIDAGFGSLDQLRGQAEDLVKIARRFKTWTGNDSREARATRGQDENELLSMMAEMGIESPVTKTTSGGNVRVYREQLSRQMAGFLQAPILQVGGIMTLSDAYCLVIRNRASTELVSPEDFRIACDYFRPLQLAIEVVKLESGVIALSIDSSKDDSGARALRKLAEEKNSITPIDVVRIRHVPIQRATFMLEDAERLGLLARDATTEGLRFFPNMFESFTSNKLQATSGS